MRQALSYRHIELLLLVAGCIVTATANDLSDAEVCQSTCFEEQAGELRNVKDQLRNIKVQLTNVSRELEQFGKEQARKLEQQNKLLECVYRNKDAAICAPNCPNIVDGPRFITVGVKELQVLETCSDSGAVDVTLLNGSIYILCRSNTIEVCDTLNATAYRKLKGFIDPPLGYVTYLTSCQADMRLYACTRTNCMKYDVTTGGHWTDWITIPEGAEVVSLLVTSDCRALVVTAIYENDDYSSYALRVYNSNFSEGRSISVADGTDFALATPGGGYVASAISIVSQLDAEGRPIRSYVGGEGNGPRLVNLGGLAIDPFTGRIVVNDYGSDRIVLLECDLSIGRELIRSQGSDSVRGMSYDPATGQLIVAYYKSTRIYSVE